MNPGKGMAQASHATSSFEYWSRQRYARENFGDSIDRWRGETGYFGTTIVLEGSKEEIQKLFADFFGRCGFIYDPTYPITNSYQTYTTCGWAFLPGEMEKPELLEKLKLHR